MRAMRAARSGSGAAESELVALARPVPPRKARSRKGPSKPVRAAGTAEWEASSSCVTLGSDIGVSGRARPLRPELGRCRRNAPVSTDGREFTAAQDEQPCAGADLRAARADLAGDRMAEGRQRIEQAQTALLNARR